MVASNLKLIFKYLKLNLAKEAQYKTSFMLQILMMILNDAFFILQWIIIFSITETIGGWGFREVMLLWGLGAGSYGVAHLFFNNAFSIGDLVYEGKLDVYLTQPKNVLINLCSSSTSVSALGDIMYSFIALMVAGAPWWWYLMIIPISIISGLIYVGVIVCYQSLSFYVKRGNSIADVISSNITMFGNYPPVIFGFVSRFILYTIIPVGFTAFIPAQYLFIEFKPLYFLLLVLIMIFVLFLAFFLFNKGLKRYNSGSIMQGRL